MALTLDEPTWATGSWATDAWADDSWDVGEEEAPTSVSGSAAWQSSILMLWYLVVGLFR